MQIKSLELTEKAAENIKTIRETLDPPAGRKLATVNQTVLHILENLSEGMPGRKPTGPTKETIAKIDEFVKSQMKLNKETDKTIVIGVGKNAETVKYEQRSITQSWMMQEAGANADAIQHYANENEEMIDEHNKWLIDQCGYRVDSDASKAINNFNRRTAKAEKRMTGDK